MPTPIRTDVRSMQRRLSLILATQISTLRKIQIQQQRMLSDEQVAQLEKLGRCLADQARLRRQIDADLKKELGNKSDTELEEIAHANADASAKPAAPDAGHPPPEPRSDAPRAKPGRAQESRGSVGAKAKR
jgi:hypothetical protein